MKKYNNYQAILLFINIILLFKFTISSSSNTILGNSILRDDNYSILKGERIAILSNPTGIFQDTFTHIVDDMNSKSKKLDFDLIMILGPEHGFRGDQQAETGDPLYYKDNVTGLPVISAYYLTPSNITNILDVSNITAIVVDIQDVGTRLYTFIWTMYQVMLAASNAKHNIRIIVCDRPNPLGGIIVDGPMLDMNYVSGYGRANIPFLHGMTIGELSLYFNTLFDKPLISGIEIIKMKNWNRSMLFKDTNLPWIPPSPNLPTPFSAQAYGATVFIEATTVSEGRGTTTPFTLFGAPFIDTTQLALKLNNAFHCLSNYACFRSAYYDPTFAKYNGTVVPGVQFLEGRSGEVYFGDFKSATIILSILKELSIPSSSFVWDGSWFGHNGTELIDEYAGTNMYRIMLDEHKSVDEILLYFKPDRDLFISNTRSKFLLY